MRTKFLFTCATFVAATSLACAQQSPPAQTSVSFGDKTLTIKYSAPSVRGRQIFGDGGKLSQDGTYPVWRAGANNATSFHTDADLYIKDLKVPAGDYTIYVQVTPEPWELIISKQTKQWGTVYKKDMDLGRVKMDMSAPGAPVETYKMTLSSSGAKDGKLQLEWDKYAASVPFKVN
jgi:hypothetical protein